MLRPEADVKAELDRWKARMIELRFLRQMAKTKDARAEYSIEGAYAAIIVGALSYTLGEAPAAAVRIKVE